MAYLGHVISTDGVAMDANKVAAVAAWPSPRSAWGLRGFLGLAGYYWKFIWEFGLIVVPLTRLLRRDAFAWDTEAEEAFQALKRALTTGPVLQMPDFNKLFMVALRWELGARKNLIFDEFVFLWQIAFVVFEVCMTKQCLN